MLPLDFVAPIILGRAAGLSDADGRDATTSDLASGVAARFVSSLAAGGATRAGGGAASAIVTGMVRLDCVTVPSGALARRVSS
ncbi:hypothetical protein ABIE85_006310 [Bradyrhizobium diazoefficiens]